MEIQTSGKSQALTDKELIKILLVEDDAVDSRLVKQLLASCSQPLEFAVESVGSLSEAIECLTNRKYDIVLSDLGLPDSSGIETVQNLKQVTPNTPVVVLTGVDDEEIGLSAIRNGASDYLVKDLPVKDLPLKVLLVRTIRYALEHSNVEKEVKALRQQLEFVLGATKTGVDIIDSEFNIRYINSEWKKVYGDPAGKKCYEYFMDRSEVCPGCGIIKALKTKKPVVTEEVLVKEGNKPIQVTAIPFQNEKEEWLVAEVHVDITERKKAEEVLENLNAELSKANENLKNTEANLRTMINQNADGILIIDHKGIIRFVNNAAELLFGRKKEELIGETFGFADVKDETTEIEIIRKKGEIVTAEMCTVEIEWEGEMVYLASLRDITKRKKAEKKLKETMKMKSEFISTVSHELRTPLTIIKGGIAFVLNGLAGDINEEQKELLGIAKKNVDRLARLINDVLDFQKLDSGKMKFNLEANDINQIVKDVYETMTSSAKATGLDILLELDQNLPKATFDSDKITQVLTNLVTNALKFTEKGTITIKTTKTEDAVQVSVSDTGYGIRKEDMPKLFSRFEQLGHGGDRKTGGTGLGLAISKEIIERHNGEIWLESNPGKGSKFTFTLPIYSTEGLLKKYINDGIRDASKNDTKMSLILISIADFDKLEQKLPHEKINSTLEDMEALLENSVRHSPYRATDAVFKLSSDVFVVLANCDKENTLRVKERLEQKLDGYLTGQNLGDKIKLLFGCATYPDDATTSEDLTKKARELQPMLPMSASV